MDMSQDHTMQHMPLVAAFRELLFRWWLAMSRDPITITEIIFGGWTALWGAFLFGPWDAFGSQSWAIIRATGIPENAFGGWLILWGVLQAIEVRRRIGRIVVALILMVTWGLIALALMWVNPATTGTAIYPIFAIMQIYIFLRLASRPTQDSA